MKRVPLKRTTGLRSMSPKRRAALPERTRTCNEVLARDQHRCQFGFYVLDAVFSGNPPAFPYPTECAGPLDVHEIIPRSAWPDGWLVPSNCVCVCRTHHSWIGDNPSAAHALGLHGYSHERPDYPQEKQ